MLSVLVIGSLPPPIGGTSVSLQHLVIALGKREDIRLEVINTAGIRNFGLRGSYRFLCLVKELVAIVRRTDVVTLHVGLHALPAIASILWAICRLSGRPLLIRRFGGNDHRELRGLAFRLVDWTIRRADLYLVQTQSLVRGAKGAGIENVDWFPTSRPASPKCDPINSTKNSCRRFIFLSHVKPTKGIREIITATERFCGKVTVDVYGPFYDGMNKSTFDGCKYVHYRGVVPPEAIRETLKQHDAFLLPTYYEGEGYPGAIIEAFGAGLPVITTDWKSIPEMVNSNCGLLVPPGDAEALYNAMSTIVENDALYRHLSSGALEQHKFFDLEVWTDHFVEHCRSLANKTQD